MFQGLDHIAIVVADTEEALALWRDRLGFDVLLQEDVNGGTVRLTHLDLANAQLQLVQPLTPDHPLQQWLREHGSGLHHLCLRVEDVADAHAAASARGFVAPETPLHQGTQGKRALFLDKAHTGGIQLEVTGK